MPQKQNREIYRLARLAGQATFIPIFLVVFPLAFYLIGTQLDAWCGTEPWLSGIFLFLGLLSAFRQVTKVIKRISSDDLP